MKIAIGIIGRLVPIKNHSFFIDIVQKLITNSNRKLRIFIVEMEKIRKKYNSKS